MSDCGESVSIEPNAFDNEEIRYDLAKEIADLTPEELERMAEMQPRAAHVDERGRIHGRIVSIRGGDVFVDIGGKADAVLPLEEFEPSQPPAVGQLRTFILHGMDPGSGLVRLSLSEKKVAGDIHDLKVGDVIEARVTGVNLGGLELESRGVRCFMPKSQVDLHRIEDFAPYIGHRFECEITEVDRRAKTVVLSRRRLLERQREEQREQLRGTLNVGQVLKGIVRRLADFGAFVDIGGVEGLLHISDMSYARLKHPSEVLKEGEEIQVQILRIDTEKQRISLGAKQLQPDPWNVAGANYRAGASADGKVTRLMDFGAFVELEPGIEGLIPISEISWTQRVRHPKEVLKEGDSARVQVIHVDLEKRKITLSLKALAEDPWKNVTEKYPPDAIVSAMVKQIVDFGAFCQLEEGVEGLVHISEMSDKRIKTPHEAVKVGDVVQVRVKAVDSGQHRVSLSMRLQKPEPIQHIASAEAARPAPPKKKKILRGGLD